MNSESLKESLNYLYVKELKELCSRLSLSQKGTKPYLTSRIVHFIETKERIEQPKYPTISCANKNKTSEIKPENRMLKGLYKNDLKTRIFFKKLIGNHFHFTAFGIDWLNERWLSGNPPTYQEFAEMWQKEYLLRKDFPSPPKEEWAYIRFVKDYLKFEPSANQIEILEK